MEVLLVRLHTQKLVGRTDVAIGFHANTAKEYAAAFSKALSFSSKEALIMRQRARKSAKRFSEEGFARSWVGQLDKLVSVYTGEVSGRRI